MQLGKNQQEFFELLRAGLWEKESRLFQCKDIDRAVIKQMADEQSVQGLVLQGIECLKKYNVNFDDNANEGLADSPQVSINIPQALLLQWIGEVQLIEQRNREMNVFVADLFEKLRNQGINALLVKGQGIAQCYERPLWRTSGDVDLLLSESNYERAKGLLRPLASAVETEYTHFKHLGMTIDGWNVELHGTLHSRLSRRMDDCIDAVQREVNANWEVRTWLNGSTQVFLPTPGEDVIFVFTHILKHFYIEGIGLRQICDWCRLLWTCKDSLNHGLLELRIRKMGLTTEWKAFAAFAVKWLGMPVEAMPLFDDNDNLDKKADKICKFVLEVGNFGHKQRRDYSGMSYLRRKFVSAWGRLSDMLRHFQLFPKDSIVFFGGVLRSGLYAALRGE